MIPTDGNNNTSSNIFNWGATSRRLPAVLTPSTETNSSLEDIIRQYSRKPELLELILMSKVQEDRRRAEEAKLRSKEIDYILQKEQHPSTPPSPELQPQHHHRRSLPSLPAIMDLDKNTSIPYRSPSLTSSSFGSPRSTPEHGPATSPRQREEHMTSTLLHPTTTDRLLPTILPANTSPERPASPVVSASQEIRQLLASRKRLSSSGPSPNEPYAYNSNPPLQLPMSQENEHRDKRRSLQEESINNLSQENKTHIYHYYYGPNPPNKLPLPPAPQSTMTAASSMSNIPNPIQNRPFAKRRRREMQAITMIIETREFPYNDDYLWKNNGNTIHKGSGNKSIYYKCANNQKGCPVNKTVTFKDNGEYLIKYRGKHLDDCSRIKRVVDV
ncbi:hypothetical protein BJV82DRAFT_276871 [Fennellomyces sp. T-0311]|nr:hypothetical protein BJV82DRAFT_276871 [Fennellomyces sp. T-0311]